MNEWLYFLNCTQIYADIGKDLWTEVNNKYNKYTGHTDDCPAPLDLIKWCMSTHL